MAILGGNLWSPLAIAIIGGLLYSTFLTLLVVPCLYYAVMRKQMEKQGALLPHPRRGYNSSRKGGRRFSPPSPKGFLSGLFISTGGNMERSGRLTDGQTYRNHRRRVGRVGMWSPFGGSGVPRDRIGKAHCCGRLRFSFSTQGVPVDVSLHGLGGMDEGGMLHNILEKCDVLSRIQPVRKKLSYSVKLNGRILDIPQETRHYQELLEEVFPFERNEIRQLFADLAQMSRDIRSKTLDSPLLKKWLRMSTFDALRSYPLSKEFIDLFCAKWIYYGLPPSRLSALYFFIPWISYHMEGTYYLRGGSQTLSDAFAETIRRNGGEIRLRSQVVKILTGEKKVTGVVLKNGDVLSCDWIVSNANPILTFNKLLPPEEPIESYRSKLKKMEIGSSLFQLYLGLSCDPQKIGFNREDCYFMDEPDTDRDYQHSVNKDYEKVNINVTNYSAIDPLLQGKNRGVLAVTGVDFMKNWPEDRREYRKQNSGLFRFC